MLESKKCMLYLYFIQIRDTTSVTYNDAIKEIFVDTTDKN